MLLWPLLSSSLVVLLLHATTALCPPQCACRLDEKGKRKVSCTRGGMLNPIPTPSMDLGMEILVISAPDDNWNALTLSAVFQNFRQLEEIHVMRSGLQQIGMHTFWGVTTLKVLNLSGNNISVVYDHNFRGLVNLVELNLDDNGIEWLSSDVFRHLSELRILTMQRNRLVELVPRVFLTLGKLKVLKLSGNELEDLDPDVFKDILELRVLECRSCAVRRVNGQIYNLLPYLVQLDLGYNGMPFMSDDDFVDLKRLQILKLDGNLFPVVLERTFVNQGELRSLNLAGNRLAKITNTAFLNMSSLEDLDISYNQLYKMESEIMLPVASSLRRLVLSGNKFGGSVAKVLLEVAHRVIDVALADMGLTEIPAGFLPDRLKQLNLSGNNLTALRPEALPPQLVELDLSRNHIAGLDAAVVARLEQMRTVTLEGNPWRCDRMHIGALLQRGANASFGNLTCASPNSLKGTPLSHLLEDELDYFQDDEDEISFLLDNLALLLGIASLAAFLVLSLMFTFFCKKRSRNARIEEEKRRSTEEREMMENPTELFSKDEISFKFSLDLTERKVSVSTIDDMKKETRLQTLPNGTGI